MSKHIEPLSEISIDPAIVTLPKADIHIHQEWSPRLDRVLSKREGRAAYNWQQWSANLMQTELPGEARLAHISSQFPASKDQDDIPENFKARLLDLLEEAANDGAILLELRFGKDLVNRPDCLALFREAEKEIQMNYPKFYAAAIPFIDMSWDSEELKSLIGTYCKWADEGLLFGVDLLNRPYATEGDWTQAYYFADQLAEAGLGITVHVAEVSPANLKSALNLSGLKRLGHATHAGYHPDLLELVVDSGLTVECSLTCNVIFGAAASYEAHPIRTFVEAGIPVAICTDDPVQICTTIGREYAIAHQLGFSIEQLLGFTNNAVQAAFISPEQRAALQTELNKNPIHN